MDLSLARQRVNDARVARLGTVTSSTRPHLVPCCFALLDEIIYTAVDAKPKTTIALRRIENLMTNPAACLLVDHYDEDWSALWWVRLDGAGRIVDSERERQVAIEALRAKYPQYQATAISDRVIGLDVHTWRTWP